MRAEEVVRQALLREMIEQLGYPKGLLAVEKELALLPTSAERGRRVDIACFTPAMKPLLLIECKARSFGDAARRQLMGYNTSVGAPFLCLASATQRLTFWSEGSVPFLPSYRELQSYAPS